MKYAKQRAIRQFKYLIFHWVGVAIFTTWLCKHFVISQGGIWPNVSGISYLQDFIAGWGGLGVFISLAAFIYSIFKGRKGTDE